LRDKWEVLKLIYGGRGRGIEVEGTLREFRAAVLSSFSHPYLSVRIDCTQFELHERCREITEKLEIHCFVGVEAEVREGWAGEAE